MKKQWQGKSLGTSWQYAIFYTLIKYGGYRLGYCLLFFVVSWYSLCPRVARTCTPYLSRRFPTASKASAFLHRWKLQWTFGKVLVDRACFGICNTLTPKFSQRDVDILNYLAQQEKGLIVLSAHMGAWQTAILPLHQALHKDVTVVLHQDNTDYEKSHFEHRKDLPLHHIDPSQGALTSIAITKALTNGGTLAFMGDRIYDADQHIAKIPFLGDTIQLSWGVLYLASITGAPIAVCLAHRTGPCQIQYEIKTVLHIPPKLGKDSAAYLPYLTQFAAIMEDFTKQHPYQFFNFYDMWSQ